jgi:hypothetical protein
MTKREPQPAEVALIGLDVGQAPDPSALAMVQRSGLVPALFGARYLRRWPLGTAYRAVVTEAARVFKDPALAGMERYFVVDATGVGRPIVEMLDELKLDPIAVTITGGFDVTVVRPTKGQQPLAVEAYHVPRRDLISTGQVLLQAKRLKIAEGLTEGEQLVQELLSLRRKLTEKGETFEPEGTGGHDDLVMALLLACWYGEHVLGNVYERRPEDESAGETVIPLKV